MVKIELKQKGKEDEIIVEVSLNSRTTELVMSSKFARKYKFKKFDRLIYTMNVNSTFNNKGIIEHIVEVELFYRGQKERIEIDRKTEEVKMIRCPNKCEKQ